MSVLIILILVSLIVAVGFLVAFVWSVRAGQYDDDYTPSVRMLFDDKTTTNNNQVKQEQPDKSKNQ
jgi:cbb3-type cytochrome oxidase maturation protein